MRQLLNMCSRFLNQFSRTSSLVKLSRLQSEEVSDSVDRLQTDRRQEPGQTSEGGSLEGTLPPVAGAAAGRHQRCTLTGSHNSLKVQTPFYNSQRSLLSIFDYSGVISSHIAADLTQRKNSESKATQQCQISIWPNSRKSCRRGCVTDATAFSRNQSRL